MVHPTNPQSLIPYAFFLTASAALRENLKRLKLEISALN